MTISDKDEATIARAIDAGIERNKNTETVLKILAAGFLGGIGALGSGFNLLGLLLMGGCFLGAMAWLRHRTRGNI